MSDPTTDPRHNLTDDPQDPDAPRYPIRLGTFLALLRVLAGRRGDASVTWWGAGFLYRVTVYRLPTSVPPFLDRDPAAIGGDEVAPEVLEALAGDDDPP